jgi:hypothetical protein
VITNVAVGRGPQTLRLFVTCESIARKTIVKIYDRNMNDELLDLINPNRTKKLTAAEKEELKNSEEARAAESAQDNTTEPSASSTPGTETGPKSETN